MQLFLLFFLILLNGMLAMTEIALLTAKRSRLGKLAENGDRAAEAAIKLGMEPTRFLSTIQAGILPLAFSTASLARASLLGRSPCGFLPSAWTRSSAVLRPQPLP